MAYTTTKKMLLEAKKNGYAIAAFNAENMEMVQGIIKAANEKKAPVIIQTTPSTVKYGSVGLFSGMVKAEAEKSGVDIALHLDHGDSFELAKSALEGGYSSIMIDGSQKSFEENIALTCSVVEVAKKMSISVEAELGTVGGKEDGLVSKGEIYTDPAQALEFATRTNIDSLAIAIGTAHGLYKNTPVLDKDRLSKIASIVDVPLVLHGASGISDDDLIECIKRGISKINFATELRIAYSDGVKSCIEADSEVFDPKKYGAMGREFVYELAKKKLTVCGF